MESLHDGLHRLWLDENGDWVQVGYLQAFDGVAAHVQNAMLALLEFEQNYDQRQGEKNH